MNVKSQSELDIGGRKTCNTLQYSQITEFCMLFCIIDGAEHLHDLIQMGT